MTAGGFKWSVTTRPAPLGRSGLSEGALQEIEILSVGQTDCAIDESSWIQLLKGCPAMSAL